MDDDILRAIQQIQRRTGRVYAWMVQAYLDVYRSEQTIRRDMARLAEQGLLERLGERKGYRVRSPHARRRDWQPPAARLAGWMPRGVSYGG